MPQQKDRSCRATIETLRSDRNENSKLDFTFSNDS